MATGFDTLVLDPDFIPLPDTTFVTNFDSDRNYILEITPVQGSGTIDVDSKSIHLNASGSRVATKITYFDGLGRPEQVVRLGMTTGHKDLIDYYQYDAAGREHKNWLPTPISSTNRGRYIPFSTYASLSTNFYDDENPFVETSYEGSPLRPADLRKAGTEWRSHPATMTYRNNRSAEVGKYTVSNDILHRSGYYPAGQLSVTEATDEDGKKILTYTDKSGQIVMERRGGNCDTYYVYDDLGQLIYVLPPNASDALNTDGSWNRTHSVLALYGYIYTYDARGNCTNKKLPGIDEIKMIYDKGDRLAMSQNGNQRKKDQWTVYKYDCFDRLLFSYIISSGNIEFQQATLQCRNILFNESPDLSPGSWRGIGYTNNIFSQDEVQLLTVYYYDDYGFLDILDTSVANRLTYKRKTGYSQQAAAKTYLTGKRVYSLTNDDQFEIEALYYDRFGNHIASCTRNINGEYSYAYQKCDLSGTVLKSFAEYQTADGGSVTESAEHTYDHDSRLTRTRYTLNDTLVNTRYFQYDELGRLTRLSRNNGTTHASYEYDLQGNITSIKDVDFEQKLYYNTGDGTPRYNGKISSIKWLTPSIDNTDTITNGYSFVYDQQDRLVSAYSSSGKYGQERYTEEFTYDKQGNIAMLYRYGGENGHLIDETSWNYNGNQVTRITDISGDQSAYNIKEYHDYNHSGDDFYYDSNGNMTADLDRDIVTIRYNAIDLPDTVQFKNGSTIIYHYLADGRKIKAQYTTSYSAIIVPRGETLASMGLTIRAMSSMSAWNGPLEYIGSPFACDSLIRIHNRYGYYDCREKEFRYYTTDYQGNVRTVYSNIKINIIKPVKTLSSSANIVLPPIRFVKVHQRMQYYPDGLPYDECYRADEQPYKYGELEFIEMHGFDSYDNGRRHYSPAMHRFTSFDPLAEHFYHESPYAHCGNDPVNYIDPSGMDYWGTNDPDEIEKFWDSILSGDGNIDMSEWDYLSDDEFADISKTLMYNSDNGCWYTFYVNSNPSSYSSNGREYVINGISLPNINWNPFARDARWYQQASGQITPTNDLFYLIAGIKLLSNKRFLPIWQAPKKSPPLGQYTVYIARDENKNVIYVGMTNNFLRRRAEHANRFMIEKYRSNLTKYDARALEQALIEHYKFRRDGGTLLNKINSISRKNPIYEDAIKVGNSYINNL